MITGIYRSTEGVTGIISNCGAAEAETHSDTQRNRGREGREGGRNESRKIQGVSKRALQL